MFMYHQTKFMDEFFDFGLALALNVYLYDSNLCNCLIGKLGIYKDLYIVEQIIYQVDTQL